ncbi:MAG: hypothetical protein RMJ44_04575 [Cytophagales bacterium]|nr:hypothetical protein [Bernardetiaceae bacterium]MDW8210340.1 hypothetical protein [Cytophagales bacterium]
MKNYLRSVLLAFIIGATSSCGINNHNRAELVPVNENDTRIYGNIGGPPLQLANKYEEDKTGKTQERINAIRDKFFPK